MASPSQTSSTVLTCSIKVNGSVLEDTIMVVSLEVNYKINRVPVAQIVIAENVDLEMGEFMIDDAVFEPGKEIEVSVGYENSNTVVFKGLIIKNSLRANGQEATTIVLDCRSELIKMTLVKNNKVFIKQKDSDVISALISDAGLSATVDATDTQHAQLFQYHSTDWDFMLNRAEANGLYLFPNPTGIKVGAPTFDSAVYTLTYGVDIIRADLVLDAQNQYNNVEAYSWDANKQEVVVSTSTEPAVNSQGNISTGTLKDVVGSPTYKQYAAGFVAKPELDAWTKGRIERARLSRIGGTVDSMGSADVSVGDIVELAKISQKFNGSAYVSGVRHTVSEGTWTTSLQLGLSNMPYYEEHELSDLAAGGLLPAVNGLVVGMVTKIHEDEESLGRVEIAVQLDGDATHKIWARLLSPYASNGFGAYFYPEVGDEVIVGFVNDDPRDAIIMGAVHGKNKAPYTPDADNFIKGWVTKQKMKLTFDDEKKIITIETPGGNKAILDDDAKSITLQDMNSNKVTLSDSGIDLNTPKDVMIKATGKITLDGTGGVVVKSGGGDVKISGLNVEAAANIGATVKGNATAELSASGQTTVKGAMVMIN